MAQSSRTVISLKYLTPTQKLSSKNLYHQQNNKVKVKVNSMRALKKMKRYENP
jgi:hypothetical protein